MVMSNKTKKHDAGEKNPRKSRREFLRQATAIGLGAAVTPKLFTTSAVASTLPPLIYGYPARASVVPGENLRLHYLTNQPWFRVRIFRQGKDGNGHPVPIEYQYQTLGWQPASIIIPDDYFGARNAPPGGSPDQTSDWMYPYVDIQIPSDWPSGAYVAMFDTTADPASGQINQPDKGYSTPDGQFGKALFVVKSAPGSATKILYKLSLTTYHAYNYTGWVSMYQNLEWKADLGGYKVTMLRPGGGTGCIVSNFGRFDESGVPLNSFSYWDPHMIAWLENNQHVVDYCTDVDLHLDQDGSLLSKYKLLLSVGHDEYWSQEMRDNLAAFVAKGGNVAFFSGNSCFWRIRFTDFQQGTPTAFVCDKSIGFDSSHQPIYVGYHGNETWWELGSPENSLTGVSLRNAGDSVSTGTTPQPKGGYTVQLENPIENQWVYAGTGLTEGMVFGEEEGLVSYECDGAEYEGTPRVPTTRDGTPPNFQILGFCETSAAAGWYHYPRENQLVNIRAATIGYYTNIGTVFTGATTDWARVLKAGNAAVSKITDNVIKGLSTTPRVAAAGKFDADSNCDIVFQNPINSQLSIWYMSGATATRSAYVPHRQEMGWPLKAAADFTGDGNLDFIFYNPLTGQMAIWYMDGNRLVGGEYVNQLQQLGWPLVAVADFNGNGKPDLVFHNPLTGQLAIWYMNGAAIVGGEFVNQPQVTDWTPVAAADFNGDGKSDLIFYNIDGRMVIWHMNGATVLDGQWVQPQIPGWPLVAVADFTGDGTPDLLFQNQVTGEMAIWYMRYDTAEAQPVGGQFVTPIP